MTSVFLMIKNIFHAAVAAFLAVPDLLPLASRRRMRAAWKVNCVRLAVRPSWSK